jgi:hypothetical protein
VPLRVFDLDRSAVTISIMYYIIGCVLYLVAESDEISLCFLPDIVVALEK